MIMILDIKLRYLQEHMDEWLGEQLEDYIDDDYLLFDCPGAQFVTVDFVDTLCALYSISTALHVQAP